MPLIDEDGNLFGVINAIDALVVVLALAVVVTGITMAVGDSTERETDSETETRYATIALGEQPEYVAEQIEESDSITIRETGETVTVTDVYVTPARSEPEAMIRAELKGKSRESGSGQEEFYVGGEPLLLGTDLTFDVGSYRANGTVTDISQDDASLSIEETTAVTEITLENTTPSIAERLEEGMNATVRGDTIATVESVEQEPTLVITESDDGELHEREHPRNVDVVLTVEVQVTESEDGMYFRGNSHQIGEPIALDFGEVLVQGTITDVE